ncbi:MAG: hypothetical protein LUC60_01145 [Lachnospiraceae bacterium]|nr:hypothetical protein [Lachnospiraceae bacterium]
MLLVLYGLMFTELMVIYQFGMKMFNSQITLLKFCFGVIDFLAVAGFLTVLFRHLPKWTDEGYIG